MLLVSRSMFLGSRNKMETYWKLSDQQGCQMRHQGCQIHINWFKNWWFYRNLTMIFITLELIDPEKCFWCLDPCFWGQGTRWTHIQSCQTIRVARFNHQGCQIRMKGLKKAITLELIDLETGFWCPDQFFWGRGTRWRHIQSCQTNRIARFDNQGCQICINEFQKANFS